MTLNSSYKTDPIKEAQVDAQKRKKNTFRISLGTGIALGLISIISGIVTPNDGWTSYVGTAVAGIVAIAAFVSAYLTTKDRPVMGSLVLLGTMFLSAFSFIFVSHGQGLALGGVAAILMTAIASNTLPQKYALRMTIGGVVAGVAIAVSDLLGADFGLPTYPQYTNIFAGILSVGYLLFILKDFRKYRLQTKLLTAFSLITFIPLIILSYYSYSTTKVALLKSANDTLRNLAQLTGEAVDAYISNQLSMLKTEAQQPAIIRYMNLPDSARVESRPETIEASNVLLAFVRKDPVFLNSYALLDLNGINVLDTVENNHGQDESHYSYFTQPIETGLPNVTGFVVINGKPRLFFSAPVRDEATGKVIGVLRASYDAIVLQNIVRGLVPEEGDYLLTIVNEDFVRVAYTGDQEQLFHTYKNFSETEIVNLQTQGRLIPEETNIGANIEMVDGLNKLSQESSFSTNSISLGGKALTTGIKMRNLPWLAVARQKESTATQGADLQNRTLILVVLAMTAAAMLSAFFAARFLTEPIKSLTQTAQRVSDGNLYVRAFVNTDDEVGDLAKTFNTMTERLSETLNGLEQRVVERTSEAETSRQQSEKRAQELQAISEVSRAIATEQNIEKLLPLVAYLVSDKFAFYHVGIFLVDNFRRYAVLQASNSDGGQRMLERGHRLEVGQTGLVGYVAHTGKARIALDTGSDAVYFNNPDLPYTHSEIALPLTVRGKTIGVLDVQSKDINAFNQADTSTLGVLADQIAIAIENARLFQQTQQALSEAQSLYSQYLGQAWEETSKRGNLGYMQTALGGRTLDSIVQTEEIQAALQKGDLVVIMPEAEKTDNATTDSTIIVPIKLRDEVLGVLNVRSPERGYRWSRDEINMVRSISERLALSLETARLFNDARQRAEQERTIAELANKISASTEMEEIMRTTVDELRRVLGASEVFVQIEEQGGN